MRFLLHPICELGVISLSAKGEAKEKLEHAMLGVTDKYMLLEECEKKYVRKALLEERRHYCDFICCVRPVVVGFIRSTNLVCYTFR